MRNDSAPGPDERIEAAGAVVWRPADAGGGVLVALVHRPRYDDWSLPKGKAETGETAPLTAVREVEEETGVAVALGRALTTVSYTVAAGPKTVHYFAARARGGTFAANREVDRLEWLTPEAARERLSYEFDHAVLDTFLLEPAALRTVVFVRHARAGHREAFSGPDAARPLDGKGRRQAAALVAQLRPFAPVAVHSAPLERCRATVAPLADALELPITDEPALAEDAYRDDPAQARRRLVELAEQVLIRPATSTDPATDVDVDQGAGIGALVACSQGGVIPGVVKSLAGRSHMTMPAMGTPKAAYWVLSFDGRRLIQADRYPAPAV